MNLFKKDFWVETEEKNEVEKAVEKAKAKTPQPTTTSAPPVQTYAYNPGSPDASLSPEVKQHFLALIKGKNLPGPDFYEFSQMLVALAAVGDESTRYNAAFTGLSATSGLTMDKLRESIKFYKQLVQTSLSEFSKTFDSEFKKQVTDARNSIGDKRAKLVELQQQIDNLQTEIAQTDNRANEAEVALNNQKDKFLQGGQLFIDDLGNELGKIERYIVQ